MKPMDIAFAVDSSDDISSQNWQYIIQFLQAMVDGIGNVNPFSTGTRFGLVSYANAPVVGFKFNTLSGSKINAVEVKKLIGMAPRQQGNERRMDLAIQTVVKDLFSDAGGSRTNSRRVKLFYFHDNYLYHCRLILFFIFINVLFFHCECFHLSYLMSSFVFIIDLLCVFGCPVVFINVLFLFISLSSFVFFNVLCWSIFLCLLLIV